MISLNRIEAEKKHIIKSCKSCKGLGCGICYKYCVFLDKLAEAEIPLDYWHRKMEDFYGEQNFKEVVLNYMNSIEKHFSRGLVHCFAGHRGTGKTMAACSILKAAILKGYSAYYTTMVDSVSHLLSPASYNYRDLVKKIDFLVIDEVDQRFFPSPGSQQLYGNHFENVLRMRAQNKLPTIICTNSEDVSQIFGGEFEVSFASLRAQFVKVLRAGGKDARQSKEKL